MKIVDAVPKRKQRLQKLNAYLTLIGDTRTKFPPNFVPKDVTKYIEQMAPQLRDTIDEVEVTPEEEDGKLRFQPILTEDGLCFTYNMLPSNEFFTDKAIQHRANYLQYNRSSGWTSEDGYSGDESEINYPFHDEYGPITVHLSPNYSEAGFKVLIHNPAEFPEDHAQNFYVKEAKEYTVSVSPSVMYTSSGLRSYQPQQRQCYYPHERQLKFFKVYMLENCYIECLGNYMLNVCGCVDFFFPRERNVSVCSSAVKSCPDDYQWRDEDCGCLDPCTDVQYDVGVPVVEYEERDLNTPERQHISLVIRWKRLTYVAKIRNELYGQADFIAYCGGLLGLGMGISALSLLEVLYWMLIRPCCSVYRRFMRHRPSSSEELK